MTFQNDQEQSLAEVREDRRTQRWSEPFPSSIKGEGQGARQLETYADWLAAYEMLAGGLGKVLLAKDANAMLITLSMVKLLVHRLRLQELLVFLFN